MTSLTFLVGEEVGSPTSGESRFVFNLLRALSRLGAETTLCAASVTETACRSLEGEHVRVVSMNERTQSALFQSRLVTGSRALGRSLSKEALKVGSCDWYIVFDQAIAASRYLDGTRKAFVCNGDFALLFLNKGFYRSGKALKRFLSARACGAILDNAESVRLYDSRFANSHFTQSFMSYIYECQFEELLYPPVDPDIFRPSGVKQDDKYVLSMMRNMNEQNLHILERIAKEVPLKVVGTATVPGASSTGVVDDSVLARLYSEASFLAFPILSEFFGYAVAESISCATPALVMPGAGPAEIIENGFSGWHASNEDDFVTRAVQVYKKGYEPALRAQAHRAAHRFSMEVVGKEFLSCLERKAIHC